MQTAELNQVVRQAAAVHFKNFIKYNWNEPSFPEDAKNFVKGCIVQLMLSSPNALQVQLAEAMTEVTSSKEFL